MGAGGPTAAQPPGAAARGPRRRGGRAAAARGARSREGCSTSPACPSSCPQPHFPRTAAVAPTPGVVGERGARGPTTPARRAANMRRRERDARRTGANRAPAGAGLLPVRASLDALGAPAPTRGDLPLQPLRPYARAPARPRVSSRRSRPAGTRSRATRPARGTSKWRLRADEAGPSGGDDGR